MIFMRFWIFCVYNYTFDGIFNLSVFVDVLGRQMGKKSGQIM
jgi:hypothetical protein